MNSMESGGEQAEIWGHGILRRAQYSDNWDIIRTIKFKYFFWWELQQGYNGQKYRDNNQDFNMY